MAAWKFTKMQGVGNDFVVIDGRERQDTDWPALAVQMCDRHIGVGADGLLVLDNTPSADFLMRMYNPDGSSDICGNGLRCIARYAWEHNIVQSEEMRILTLAGVRAAQLHLDAWGNVQSVTVDMGQPVFVPADIPMRIADDRVFNYPLLLTDGTTLPITALSTGSAHAVTFIDVLPADEIFFQISPQVENHSLFPERVSLMWCAPESPTRLRLRIWERGAGETWGCGTGACAAAVAAILHNHAASYTPITVASKGGELIIHWQPGDTIQMTGPAQVVYEAVYEQPGTH